MSFVCFLQGWQDRRTHQNRAKWAEQFLKQNNVLDVLSSGDPEEYPPTYTDLANLYQLIRLRKPTVIVELGTGFSTIVIAAALRDNLDEQIETPGHLYSVDCNQRWIDNTKAKISSELEDFVTFTVSSASVCEHFGTLCHRYDQLPNVSPNFIYVDGPANRDVTGEIAGVGFTEGRSVVGADVLLYESTAPLDFFILVDGRWETCRFLKRSLQGRYRHRRYVARKYETFEYISEEFY